jgi:hypothetical protein
MSSGVGEGPYPGFKLFTNGENDIHPGEAEVGVIIVNNS